MSNKQDLKSSEDAMELIRLVSELNELSEYSYFIKCEDSLVKIYCERHNVFDYAYRPIRYVLKYLKSIILMLKTHESICDEWMEE